MNWYLEVLRKYTVFEGRARRSEYWYFVLFNAVIVLVLWFFDLILGTRIKDMNIGLFSDLYSLAVLVPSLAVSVRRLHDIGKTGWLILIGFIPILGGLVLLFFMVQDSNPGDNAYGPNPKAMPAPDPAI